MAVRAIIITCDQLNWDNFRDQLGLKMITCEKHGRRVFHPLGQPCPLCSPELFEDEPTGMDPVSFYLVPDEQDQ